MIRGVIMLLLLLNEARHRILARVFGLPREDANVISMVAAGALSAGLHSGARAVLGARPHLSVVGAAMGAGAVKATASRVAGASSAATPYFTTLLVLAVLVRGFGPMVRASLGGVRGSSRAVTAGSRRLLAFLGGR
jgi:hypothetical protein